MPAALATETRDRVTVLTLSNPGKRNALDGDLCEALAAALTGCDVDATRAIVLTGAGDKAFCAGFDLEALGGAADAGDRAAATFDAMIAAVAACPVPVIAALNGAALGGGCELAATCDLRVAHPGVKLAMPPARLGIVYAPRGLARFSALCGESRARPLFLLGRAVAAEEAAAWGLVDFVVPQLAVHAEALARAAEIASLAPLSVRGMRASFEALLAQRAELPADVEQALAARRQQAWRSADAAEARAAFAAKRPPEFRGQ